MQNKFTKKELKDIVQWDVKNWSNVLPFWEEHFDFKPNSKVLALGERQGGLSLYFAKKGCRIICSDYNPMPKETREIHEKHNVSDSIEYLQIDMKKINLPDNSVDVVVFKSVLGGVGNANDQKKAIKEMYRVLKKGGVLLFAENLRGSKLHQYLRTRCVNWASKWRYVSNEEIINWAQDFDSYVLESYGFFALLGRTENQRECLAYVDQILSKVTPKRWRYILFGALTK